MNENTKIICVDFDKTLVEWSSNGFPELGKPIYKTINRMKEERNRGTKFILWTCREGELLDQALEWCNQRKIHFDAVNKNLPEGIAKNRGFDPRKVYANEYWDDKAINVKDL